MLKKTLNKHTREFLETNLPENFFLLKKSNKKRKNYFSSKGKILAINLSKHIQINKTYNTSEKTIFNGLKSKLLSLHAIKSTFEKRQSRTSFFKSKLKEKKKLSILYGNLSNKSIRKALNQARLLRGNLSENLLYMLESRLDIILYRSLFFPSIKAAKQSVKCNKILVNSFCINVPSYSIKYGDIISIVKKNQKHVANNMLKHFTHYNIVQKPTQTFLQADNGSQKLHTYFAGNNSNDKSSVQPCYINNFTQYLNLNAETFAEYSYCFPKWDYDLVSSIYKNINLLNETFAQNLILCKNIIYGNLYAQKSKSRNMHVHSTYEVVSKKHRFLQTQLEKSINTACPRFLRYKVKKTSGGFFYPRTFFQIAKHTRTKYQLLTNARSQQVHSTLVDNMPVFLDLCKNTYMQSYSKFMSCKNRDTIQVAATWLPQFFGFRYQYIGGKESKTVFLHMWKNIITLNKNNVDSVHVTKNFRKNILENENVGMFNSYDEHSFAATDGKTTFYGNTFLETSIVNPIKNMFKIFAINRNYNQKACLEVAKKPCCKYLLKNHKVIFPARYTGTEYNAITSKIAIEARKSRVVEKDKIFLRQPSPKSIFATQRKKTSEMGLDIYSAKRTGAQYFSSIFSVFNSCKKKTHFLNKSMFDIKFTTKLVNSLNKNKYNLYNIFCKLNFSMNNWQESIIFFTKKQNISKKVGGAIKKAPAFFYSKKSDSFFSIHTTGCIYGFFSKNFFSFKNTFKKKHRYTISNMYMKILVNQIKLENIFLFKHAVYLLNKNYILKDVCLKHDYITSQTFTIPQGNVSHLSKNLLKKTKNLNIYKNRLITKYKIALSKINCNFLVTIKNILKTIKSCKTNCINVKNNLINANSMVCSIKHYDLLFFLKLKKFFLYRKCHRTSNDIKHKINVKPLNLEISYKTLTIIYLYPPQKVVFPCSLDMELLLRYDM